MSDFDPVDGEAHVIVGVADAALHMYRAAIDSLPFPEDKKFPKRVDVVLTGLRKLRGSLTEAARHSRSTPNVIAALSEVRRIYDDLMIRAAAAPNSTLGQQLYAVRSRAKLSAEEVAGGAGLALDLPDELEIGSLPTDQEAKKIRNLIEALGGVVSLDFPVPGSADFNGVEQILEINGSDQPAEAASK